MKKFLLIFIILFWPILASAADITLSWDAVQDATGYKIYASVDMGITWDAGFDVGNVTTHVCLTQPDSGLILYRVSAYNDQGEAIRFEAGAWYNGSWRPPDKVRGSGIE
jgi:hypothetical protein